PDVAVIVPVARTTETHLPDPVVVERLVDGVAEIRHAVRVGGDDVEGPREMAMDRHDGRGRAAGRIGVRERENERPARGRDRPPEPARLDRGRSRKLRARKGAGQGGLVGAVEEAVVDELRLEVHGRGDLALIAGGRASTARTHGIVVGAAAKYED